MKIIALIVEDDRAVQMTFEHVLKRISDKVYVADTLEKGLRVAQDVPQLDIATLDLIMPGSTPMDVLAAVERIHKLHPECAVVIVTGSIEDGVEDASRVAQADGYCNKQALQGMDHFLALLLVALRVRVKDNAAKLAGVTRIISEFLPPAALAT